MAYNKNNIASKFKALQGVASLFYGVPIAATIVWLLNQKQGILLSVSEMLPLFAIPVFFIALTYNPVDVLGSRRCMVAVIKHVVLIALICLVGLTGISIVSIFTAGISSIDEIFSVLLNNTNLLAFLVLTAIAFAIQLVSANFLWFKKIILFEDFVPMIQAKHLVYFLGVLLGFLALIPAVLYGFSVIFGAENLPPLFPAISFFALLLVGLAMHIFLRYAYLKAELQAGKKDVEFVQQFAIDIANGVLDVKLPVERGNGLYGALEKLKNGLKANEQAKAGNQWLIEGVAGLNDVLRRNENLDDFADDVLKYLMGRINSIQAGFYIVGDANQEVEIKLVSTIAYGRKKYLQARFRNGEGYVGQCYYEKDYIYRKGLPEDYFSIGSGVLGGQKPTELLVVPLKSSNTIYGIIELASIGGLRELEIDFVRQVGDTIGQALFTLRANENTSALLRKVTESINYAERIQKYILPHEEDFTSIFPDSFLLYKPKDLVSGDFSWLYRKEPDIYFAAVDCTGHGVPGALLSVIGHFSLNESIQKISSNNPATVLDNLHESVKNNLKQEEFRDNSDGMDIALCKYSPLKKKIEFAGAHRPLLHIREGELLEYKGDKFPIGGMQYRNRKRFENHEIEVKKGDTIFIFSDGLPDQTGGADEKKFMLKRLKEILCQNHHLPMRDVKRVVNEAFADWKQGRKQVDDVLMIGIRF
jgi:serine phosphatase RsbU (regulator of sigma subunit)